MGADDRQEGGDHYRSSYQHWESCANLRLNYFQACASKYVMRHRKKNGREDVAKSKHFLEKLIELIENRRMPAVVQPDEEMQRVREIILEHFLDVNPMGDVEREAFVLMVIPNSLFDYQSAIGILDELLAEYDAAADPTTGYVNQS